MSRETPIRILLVDDHAVVREGIRSRLETQSNIHVVAEAANGLEAIEKAKEFLPDIVIMDISMPVMNGIDAAKQLQIILPEIKVLILTMHQSKEYILNLQHHGVKGYILKEVSASEMINAIETIYYGGTYYSSGVSQALLDAMSEGAKAQESTDELTARERMILAHVAKGYSSKEIARNLNISVRTVETHRRNIKAKLGVHTAAGLTKYAIEHGVLDIEDAATAHQNSSD
jgi:two-component system nitrate/nitrite response regulator NarL